MCGRASLPNLPGPAEGGWVGRWLRDLATSRSVQVERGRAVNAGQYWKNIIIMI